MSATVTNLKAATGVADDRLSAHNPNGAGNLTAMSDFLIDAVGIWDSANAVWDATLATDESGDYEDGDNFTVKFQVSRKDVPNVGTKGSEFWLQQVFDSGNLVFLENLNYNNATTINTTTDRYTYELDFTINGAGVVTVHVKIDEALNASATNHNTDLTYTSSNDSDVTVRDNTPKMDRLDYTKTASGETRFDVYLYDPDDLITEHVDFDVGTAGVDHDETCNGCDFVSWTYNHGVTTQQSKNIDLTLRDGSGGTIEQSVTVSWETDTNGQTCITSWC
jgi:hypothetical protein